jgi:hypothetical protein
MIVFEVYNDDYEPWENNTYIVGYYARLSDALKKQYRVSMQIEQDDCNYYDKYCSINYIGVIDGYSKTD